MELKFITKTVVYECSGAQTDGGCSLGVPDGCEWQLASSRSVQEVFGNDPRRLQRFQRYLKANYAGLFLVRGGQWVCYGWFSHPHSAGPPHLPRWSGRLGAYWIFGCHTHASFRQHGFYKRLLLRLTELIRQREDVAEIYIDTYVSNIPSRRAILASGFKPRGVATTCRGWAPLLGTYALAGKWRRRESHPEIGGGIPRVPSPAIASGASLKDSAR
jgi:RimJ/RimL family protein N-acetyltransferase